VFLHIILGTFSTHLAFNPVTTEGKFAPHNLLKSRKNHLVSIQLFSSTLELSICIFLRTFVMWLLYFFLLENYFPSVFIPPFHVPWKDEEISKIKLLKIQNLLKYWLRWRNAGA
jgi:hypothetical protein